MSCGVGRRCVSDPMLPCLWDRLAAVAPNRPLAWEHPYAAGATLKRQETKKKMGIELWENKREPLESITVEMQKKFNRKVGG